MRVLLIRGKPDIPTLTMPHLGLGILAAVLRRAGHDVLVLDRNITDRSYMSVFNDWRPNVLGFTLYTMTRDTDWMLDRTFGLPVLVGGPYASLYYDRLGRDPRIDYVVRGEAEGVIADLVDMAEVHPKEGLVTGIPIPMAAVPRPDFSCFVDAHRIIRYPLQTSRGCPARCSFCGIRLVGREVWQGRTPEECIQEIQAALVQFPNVHTIHMADDAPSGDIAHMKSFLELYGSLRARPALIMANIRADQIDAELLRLARRAGIRDLTIGVEHGDPEILRRTGKGETVEDIERAVALMRAHDIQANCCFVIGLPGDTLKKSWQSVELARRLRTVSVCWNVIHPFPGTPVYKWYQTHGVVNDDPNYAALTGRTLRCLDPVAWSFDFTKAERIEAYWMATAGTCNYALKPAELWRLVSGGFRYHRMGLVAWSLLHILPTWFRRNWLRAKRRFIAGAFHPVPRSM